MCCAALRASLSRDRLCDPMDCHPPGPSVPGTLQAATRVDRASIVSHINCGICNLLREINGLNTELAFYKEQSCLNSVKWPLPNKPICAWHTEIHEESGLSKKIQLLIQLDHILEVKLIIWGKEGIQ